MSRRNNQPLTPRDQRQLRRAEEKEVHEEEEMQQQLQSQVDQL